MFWNRSSSIPEIDPAQVQALLSRGDIHLVDVRESAEQKAEHIAGAICMPLSSFDPAKLKDNPKPVVLCCLSGKRSAMAARLCERAGMAVRNMRGGLAGWKAAGLPTRR